MWKVVNSFLFVKNIYIYFWSNRNRKRKDRNYEEIILKERKNKGIFFLFFKF